MAQQNGRAGRRLSISEAIRELQTGNMVELCESSLEPASVLCQAAQFIRRETLERAMKSTEHGFRVALAGERMEALHINVTITSDGSLSAANHVASVTIRGEGEENYSRSVDGHVRTIRALIDPRTRPGSLVSPGPIVVHRAYPGGTLARSGYSEAAIDLMRIAGLGLGAVLYEVTGRQEQELHEIASHVRIGIVPVDAIASYRREHRISAVTETLLPMAGTVFRLRHYQEIESGLPYLALFLGDLHGNQRPPLIRLHSACMTGDVFGSQRCDCQAQLHVALSAIAQEQRGMLLYLPQEGRGIGISAKLQAYMFQDQGYDTIEANERLGYPADARLYGSAAEVLREMGLRHVRLMTNNPQKIQALEERGIAVERVPLETPPTSSNVFYLQTKYEHLGHLFTTQPTYDPG